MLAYSLIWMNRNVHPSRNVVSIPAFSPKRLPLAIEVSAQWIVNEDDTRIAVLTPATSTGRWVPGAGHGSPCATRMKKYAVKKAPKTMISEMMKSSIPSRLVSTRELRFAAGGWAAWAGPPWETLAASISTQAAGAGAGDGDGDDATTTCSTGAEVALRTRSIRFARIQPERSLGSVEITRSSTRNSSSALSTAV